MLCVDTLVKIFRDDITGVPSFEIVRLMNRMIKEKHFNIRPEVLTPLLHLRLKTELSFPPPESQTSKREGPKLHSKGKAAARRAKGKPTTQPHLSKNARKAFKEKKQIERELREAEAEVDEEERATTVRARVLSVLPLSQTHHSRIISQAH